MLRPRAGAESRLRGLAGLALALALGCSRSPLPRWQDLLAQAGDRVEVVEVGGDRRVAVSLRPAAPLRLEGLPAGGSCELRLAAVARETAVSLTWRVESGVEGRGKEGALSIAVAPARWQEHRVELGSPTQAFAVELAVGDGEVVVAAPFVRCLSRRWSRPRDRPDIVLISIDTLRRDRLGVYDPEAKTTPFLDAFAREAVVFEEAFAVAPWTLPSHASLFTGRYPEEHGAGRTRGGDDPLGDELPTLAGLLSRAGYRTVGISGGGFAGKSYGLDRGFDRWVERLRARMGSVLPVALEAASTPSEAPFFLFFHSYDVHGPYRDPDPERIPPRPVPPEREAEWAAIREEPIHAYLEPDRFADLAALEAGYDAGVAGVDRALERLLGSLRALGLLDHTLVVITSDHGESFLEHGDYVGHSFSLHDEELAIPLIVRFPGGSPRGRWQGLVDHTDIAPLILEAAGVSGPPMSGASPRARREGREPPRRWVRGEAVNLGVLFARTRSWQLVSPPRPELASRRRLPPGVARQLERREPELRRLEGAGEGQEKQGEVRQLALLLAGLERPGGNEAAPGASPEEDAQKALRALGYLD